MQIKYLGKDKFQIKAKEGDILFGGKLSIDGFVFPGPGEYEKNKVILQGVADGENTIYVATIEEMDVCHLGHLSHKLSEEEVKKIGNVDILFVPLGDESTVDAKTASAVISSIDPRIVIPMLYTSIDEFKKEEGVSDGEMDILKIKKSELPEEERRIIILK